MMIKGKLEATRELPSPKVILPVGTQTELLKEAYYDLPKEINMKRTLRDLSKKKALLYAPDHDNPTDEGNKMRMAARSGYVAGFEAAWDLHQKLRESARDIYEAYLTEFGLSDYEIQAGDTSALGNLKAILDIESNVSNPESESAKCAFCDEPCGNDWCSAKP